MLSGIPEHHPGRAVRLTEVKAKQAVLVTGAGGFIGRHVCDRLRRGGISFLGLDHRVCEDAAPEVRTCDISDVQAISELFRNHGIATVIHLAAVLQSKARVDPALATRINIDATLHLLELAAEARVSRFVFASSVSVYGSQGSKHLFREKDAAAPIDLYGAAKRYVEIYGEQLSARGAVSFVGLRIAGVVGAGAKSRTSPWRSEIFEKLGVGTTQKIVMPFERDSVLSLVHVEDVAEMLVLLAQREHLQSRIYNSPAENWAITELKARLEALDSKVSVEIQEDGGRPAPALSDGTRFCADFLYSMPALDDRLTQAAHRDQKGSA